MKSVLNETQIEQIADTVNGSNIKSADLKEDLIDHLCCIVEDEMSKGREFETACRTALRRVCPNGLNEIQNETVFLLPSKSRKRLDRTMYISGFIALTGMLVTAIMKILHLPFAGIVLFSTAFVVVFVFFPTIFVRLLKSGKKNVSYILGFIGAWLLVLSVVFKLMHWPLDNFFLLLAILFGYLGVFPLFFFKIFKKSR
jgi:hypothetical protein